jgi:hypothetical protein
MDRWIDELASELGEDPLSQHEVGRLLEAARDVAHRVERKITPLAAFLLGAAVGRAEGGGMERSRALEDAFATLGRILPESEAPGDAGELAGRAGDGTVGDAPPS